MITDLEKKLEFIELLEKFKYIKRAIPKPESLEEDENDAEHSWHLAMMVLTFHHDYPELDLKKCLTFAIIHDLPELHAGDTPIHDTEGLKTKHEREEKAIKEILEALDPANKEMFTELFDEYENKKSKEARFVYQMDKIMPLILLVMQKGYGWKKHNVDADFVEQNKYNKVDDEFGLREIMDHYFRVAKEKGYLYYPEKN